MAARKETTGDRYKALIGTLEKGDVKPVYILMGEEAYYIDKVYEWISSNLLSEEEKDFNLTTFYGADITASVVLDQARRYPMMAARQVVIIREAQAMDASSLDALEPYLQNPPATTTLVICYMGKNIDGKKKFMKTANASKHCEVLVSDALKYDYQIIPFINDYVTQPSYNAKIDAKAAQILAAHIGGDLKRLTSELDKLQITFPENGQRIITPELIEEKIGISKQFNEFELREAIANHDALRAQRIMKYFEANPRSGGLFKVLPQIFSFFQNLMIVHYLPRPINDTAIMACLGLKSTFFTKDYQAGLRYYSARKTIEIIAKIREVDARSKGLDNANTSTADLGQELIGFIFH